MGEDTDRDRITLAGVRSQLQHHERAIVSLEIRSTELTKELSLVDKNLHGAMVRLQTLGGALMGAVLILEIMKFIGEQ